MTASTKVLAHLPKSQHAAKSQPLTGGMRSGTLVAQTQSPAGSPPALAPDSASIHDPSGAVTESARFSVSQLGHVVGDAAFHITRGGDGYDSTSTVQVSMQGLEYALSKTERLGPARHIEHEQLSATVNGSAVSVNGKPEGANFLLNMSANGRSSTSRLAAHPAAVFLPDFDPGALEILLKLANTQNNRDLWAILPKQAGSVEPIQLATYADEHGTIDGKPITVHHLVAIIAGMDTDLFSGPGDQLLQAELPQQGFSPVRQGFVLAPPKRPVVPATQ